MGYRISLPLGTVRNARVLDDLCANFVVKRGHVRSLLNAKSKFLETLLNRLC